MTSALTTYKEAISQLIDAVNALDQAHASLKDIDLHNYISTKSWGRHMSLLDAVAIADKLLFDAQNATCPDCGKPLAESEDCLSGCCPELVGHVNG
jgi:hypothetical protein